jgi:hypothetical protein
VKKFVVLIDRATPAERASVQAAIKESAKGWWHHFEDAWIVSGGSASKWRKLVKENLSDPPSGVLVLRLPDGKDERQWAYYGPFAKKRMKWLHRNYTVDS